MNIINYLCESEINSINNDRNKRVRPSTRYFMNKLHNVHPGKKLPGDALCKQW